MIGAINAGIRDKTMKVKVIIITPEPLCPECYSTMILRRPRFGEHWPPFWGCPGFPECKGKREVMLDGNPEPDGPKQRAF